MGEHPTACPDWQDDLAAWLVAQIEPDREALLEAHLGSCAACRAEAASLLAVTAVSLAADPEGTAGPIEEPPPGLGDRIVAGIAAERRTRRLLRAGMVALAGAAAVAAGVVMARDGDPEPLRGEAIAFTVMPSGATAAAIVADEEPGSVVQVTATGLDPEVTYALWLSPPEGTWDDRVAAGTFRPDEQGAVDVRLPCALPADETGRIWATTPEGEIALDTK
jgi:anti-sigma factor RsiW